MIVLGEAFDRIENEIWKDVPNYEGYYKISNYGRVKSLERRRKGTRNGVDFFMVNKERILKPIINTNGYLMVNLNKGIATPMRIHQLVAMAFLNHIPNGYNGLIVNHINGNKLDNNLINLELVTARYNVSDGCLRKSTSSKYTGVCWDKRNKKWISMVMINGTHINLGHFTDEYYASLIYNYALLNIDKFDGDTTKFRNFVKNGVKEQHKSITK